MASSSGEPTFLSTDTDAFKLEDVNAKDFLAEEMGSTDREISHKIVDDVIDNTKEWLMEREGIPADVIDKLKSLWLSKLNAQGPEARLLDHDNDEGDDDAGNDDVVVVAESGDTNEVDDVPLSKLLTKSSSVGKKKKRKRTTGLQQLDGPADSSDDDDLDQGQL